MAFDFSSLQQTDSFNIQPLRFVRKLGGATQSLLVHDEADELWVMKLNNEVTPTNHIANEVIGAHICNVLNLPAPRTRAFLVSSTFFEDQRTWLDTAEALVRPTQGLHFASRYLPQLVGRNMISSLPQTLTPCIINLNDCLGMFIFDVWAEHRDTRQVLYENCGIGLKAVFIDNGELFGGAQWSLSNNRVRVAPAHTAVMFVQNRAELIQQWIANMRERLPAAMTFAVKHLPRCWLCSDAQALVDRFLGGLNVLPDLVSLAILALEQQLTMNPIFAQDQSRRRWVTIMDPDGDEHYHCMDSDLAL